MPNATKPKADVESLAALYLRGLTSVSTLVADRVYTERPAGKPDPKVMVTRIGGVSVGNSKWLDEARIQGEAWGTTAVEAYDVAAAALAGLLDMPGLRPVSTGGANAVVTNVREDLGLQWLPDMIGGDSKPRYVFGVVVSVHPVP